MVEQGSQQFNEAWQLWVSKDHNPMEKMRLLESTDEQGRKWYQVALLDYLDLTTYVYPDDKEHRTMELALGAVGRALDENIN